MGHATALANHDRLAITGEWIEQATACVNQVRVEQGVLAVCDSILAGNIASTTHCFCTKQGRTRTNEFRLQRRNGEVKPGVLA